jgi:hypothetical protein
LIKNDVDGEDVTTYKWSYALLQFWKEKTDQLFQLSTK